MCTTKKHYKNNTVFHWNWIRKNPSKSVQDTLDSF